MKLGENKRCPRCEMKMPKHIVICPRCSLNFDKFETATNKEAKEAIRMGETDRVLMRKGLPADVNRVVLILLTVFLGFMGAHYYYVGRNKMGIFFTSFFVVGLINAALQFFPISSNYFVETITFLSLIWGIVIMLWIVDIAKVCFNRFKVPVSRR